MHTSNWVGYDTEAMAEDLADALNEATNAETSEIFSRDRDSRLGEDSHAFIVDTPTGCRFVVTITPAHHS